MNTTVPSIQDIKLALAALSYAQCQELAARSGVPFTTLWKLRVGDTENPRLETVRALWPELVATQPAREAA